MPHRVSRMLFPLLIALLPLWSASCAATPTPRSQVHIGLVGSDSMQWIARALTTAYQQNHPDITFSIQTSNSETGIRAAGEYSTTIGLVSRAIMPYELVGTRAVVIAQDGIAVIVSQKNPINAIQQSQIFQVFSGEILSWPAGPSAGKGIVVVSREAGSGTRHAFEAVVMTKSRVTPTAVVMPGEAAVVDYVGQQPEGVGYVSMGALTDQVHALVVNDVNLSPQSVEAHRYPFIRALSMVVATDPPPEIQEFVDFALSPEGQSIIGQRYGRAPTKSE